MISLILFNSIAPAVSGFFLDLFQNLLAGGILLWVGLHFYKDIKKKQTIDDIKVDIDFKVANIVASFKRFQSKSSKPMTKQSFSTLAEAEVAKIHYLCEEVSSVNIYYHFEEDKDIIILKNLCWAVKGILHCNNKELMEQNVSDNSFEFDKQNMIEFYFEQYTFFNNLMNKKIENGEFFKKHWKI